MLCPPVVWQVLYGAWAGVKDSISDGFCDSPTPLGIHSSVCLNKSHTYSLLTSSHKVLSHSHPKEKAYLPT